MHPWEPIGVHGHPWTSGISQIFDGCPWISMNTHGNLEISERVPINFMDPLGYPDLHDIHGHFHGYMDKDIENLIWTFRLKLLLPKFIKTHLGVV
jgi:hypothetical protein